MSTQTEIPQTLTVMEACFRLAPGVDDEFWKAQERFGPIALSAPGFLGVIGGPIANSSWLYFGGIFETPDHMDQWYHNKHHGAVQMAAHDTWFSSVYIRKWRLPAEGEAITGRTFAETSIARDEPLDEAAFTALQDSLNAALPQYGPRPFETSVGAFEANPYQLVGPLEEGPKLAPVRYLLLTHWDSIDKAQGWLDSPAMAAISELGEVSTRTFIPILHAQDERNHLTADGMQRGWVREPSEV
jgi:hypothetical protein